MTERFTYRIDWQGIPLSGTHTPAPAIDLIEIESDRRQPFPGSETGYRSLFITPEDMQEYADAADFARQYLDFAAEEGWHGKQLSLLFD